MPKIIFLNSQPVVTHKLQSEPLRIQRTDKAIVKLEVIVAYASDVEFSEYVFSLDPNVHADYLIEFDNGYQMSVKKWLDIKMGIISYEKPP